MFRKLTIARRRPASPPSSRPAFSSNVKASALACGAPRWSRATRNIAASMAAWQALSRLRTMASWCVPSRYSSHHSVSDAEDLVKRQGLHAATIPIAAIVDAFGASLAPAGFPETGLPAENLQARVRGVVLMALSNAAGHLVLTTGNKSELATGYSTLYGDSAGGFGPIKDVPKTLVWELSRWRNAEAELQG